MPEMAVWNRSVAPLMVCLVVLSVLPLDVQATHTTGALPAGMLEFDDENGAQFSDTLSLNGTSTFPLRNASWTVVNISGMTPTTLMSGPFLSSVEPVSEDLFSWQLVVDVASHDCTCYVELTVNEKHGPDFSSRLIVYLGDQHHRPLLPQDFTSWGNEVSSGGAMEDEGHPVLLRSSHNITLPLVTAPSSGDIVRVNALVCPAPNGVCTTAPTQVDLPFSASASHLEITIDPGALELGEGIWQFDFSATDTLLRTTNPARAAFIHDTQPPTVALNLPPTVNEGESFHVYASVDDGYDGAQYVATWSIIQPNGDRRAPSENETVSQDHLLLNFTKQGEYALNVSVRDSSGQVSHHEQKVTVLNLPPTARISVDGLVLNDMGLLTFGPRDVWELNASESFDNEAVDYLWVIDDDRSVRGTSTLSSDQFNGPDLHRIELIVFDDDGATHSTVVEIEILPEESVEQQRTSLLSILLLVVLLLVGFMLQRGSSTTDDLPKWTAQESKERLHNPPSNQLIDATVEEDEPRG